MLRVFIQAVVSLHTVILCAVVGMRLLAPVMTEERPHLLLAAYTGSMNYTVIHDTQYHQTVRLTPGWFISASTDGNYITQSVMSEYKLILDMQTQNQVRLDRRPNYNSTWSNDGTRFLLEENGDIYWFDTRNMESVPIANYSWTEKYAAWSPDDEWLSFVISHPDDWENLFIRSTTDLDSELVQLTFFTEGDILATSWSPDGIEIAYIYSTENSFSIQKVNTLTGHKTVLAENAAGIHQIHWLPDSQHIIYNLQTGRRFVSIQLHQLNTQTLESRPIDDRYVWITDFKPSPDHEWVTVVRRVGTSNVTELMYLPTGEIHSVAPEFPGTSLPHWITLP